MFDCDCSFCCCAGTELLLLHCCSVEVLLPAFAQVAVTAGAATADGTVITFCTTIVVPVDAADTAVVVGDGFDAAVVDAGAGVSVVDRPIGGIRGPAGSLGRLGGVCCCCCKCFVDVNVTEGNGDGGVRRGLMIATGGEAVVVVAAICCDGWGFGRRDTVVAVTIVVVVVESAVDCVGIGVGDTEESGAMPAPTAPASSTPGEVPAQCG